MQTPYQPKPDTLTLWHNKDRYKPTHPHLKGTLMNGNEKRNVVLYINSNKATPFNQEDINLIQAFLKLLEEKGRLSGTHTPLHNVARPTESLGAQTTAYAAPMPAEQANKLDDSIPF